MEIKNEQDFIQELGELSQKQNQVNWELLTEESKNELDSIEKELASYIENTPIPEDVTAEQQEELLIGAIEIWDRYKTAIKNAQCTVPFNVLELKELFKKTHQSVKYTAETIFYGLHLKKYLLNDLPNTKGQSDYTTYNLNITFSMSVGLYHILSTVEVVGLNKENYAFASILKKMADVSKIYQEYDNSSSRISQQIQLWNKGITQQIVGTQPEVEINDSNEQ